METTKDYDLIVIGAGSGGVRTSRLAASRGKKVAIIEKQYLGGTCVNVGCVPKKLFVYGSSFSSNFKTATDFGWSKEKHEFDWETLIENKNREIDRLNSIYHKLLENSGAELYWGEAKFKTNNEIQVGDEVLIGKNILIATGSYPTKPDVPGKEHAITSNEFFYLDSLPKKVVLVGGGYIAVEFACVLHNLGVDVCIYQRRERILNHFDKDISEFLHEELIKQGIHIFEHAVTKEINKISEGEFEIVCTNGRREKTNLVIFATGRNPNTMNLGLENTSVELGEKGEIKVNENFQTSVNNIFALGDVINRMTLTPVAIKEAMYLLDFLYEGKSNQIDYDLIPTAVFSQPNIGTVGLTEEKAKEVYGEIEVFKSSFRPLKYSLGTNPEKTFMKMIVDKKSDKVVGMHMVGDDAGEMIQGFAVAMQAGATKEIFDRTIGIHPTSAEEWVTMK